MFEHIYSSQELLTHQIDQPEWIVDGFLARGDTCVIYGEWGSGKTFLVHFLACCIGAGQPFFGKVSHTGPVLYLDKELPLSNFIRRHKMLIHGHPDLKESLFDYVSLPQYMATHMFGKQLAEYAKDYRLIILDSLRAFLVGNENQQDSISRFYDAFYALKQQGTSLVIIHHMNKTIGEPIPLKNRASGSTAILSSADLAYAVDPIIATPGHMKSRLHHIKARHPGYDDARFTYQCSWDCHSTRFEPVSEPASSTDNTSF